jgi:hypothetical protein
MDIRVGDVEVDLHAFVVAFPAGRQHDQFRTAHVDRQFDVAAQPFDQLHSPMNVIVHRFVVDVQIARPQTHLHLITALNVRIGGHRHIEGAVAQPYPSIIDNSIEKVEFRLAQRSRHKRVRGLAPNLFWCPDLHQQAFSQDRGPIAAS